MSHRPADNLHNLQSLCTPIQVGVTLKHPGAVDLKIMHRSKCHMCNASGAPFDIMRHERFNHHGHYFPIGELDDDDDMATPPTGLTPLSSLKLPQEVNQLFPRAVSAYITRKNVTTEISFGPFMLFDALSTSQECRFVDFEFQDNSCKCSVDVRHTELEHSTNFALPPYMRGQGMLDICIQTSPNTAHLDLLSLGILSCPEETSEASIETSATVQMALGLQDTWHWVFRRLVQHSFSWLSCHAPCRWTNSRLPFLDKLLRLQGLCFCPHFVSGLSDLVGRRGPKRGYCRGIGARMNRNVAVCTLLWTWIEKRVESGSRMKTFVVL
jgi:hypothetical protein